MDHNSELKQKINRCQGKDRHRFRRRLTRARHDAVAHNKLLDEIELSIARRANRASANLDITIPESLPIASRRQELTKAIAEHQVVVVAGETGSGKTTQLPKICLDMGRGVDGLIGHTQPRRLAARTVASRVAEELGGELGDLVGFQTRFHQRLSDNNRIKVMTDGILLAETQRDPWLNHYDTLILDEAHERSLNIDFLLGYLKQRLHRRRDLKLIITSATLDVDRFSRHFDNAPVITIEGRGFPVEIRYRPLTREDEDEDVDVNRAIIEAIEELQTEGRGDVLVFLPGEREIRDASRALRHLRNRFEVHALYARLSPAEQQRIFKPGQQTRIILSTNVAETSLTVPGIRYVVDTGTARVSRYSWRAQIQRLPVEKISQASAAQRAGRCGRTAPGICIRTYGEEDYSARTNFTQPEIQRTNLAAVILQMENLRLGSITDFPFIDAPDRRLIKDGYRLLNELQAIDERRQLTTIGRRLARVPIDPRLGRMLLAAEKFKSVAEVSIIVTALAVSDPRERPFEKRAAADQSHARFNDKQSDFAGLLNLWAYLDTQSAALSQSALRRLCIREFINFKRWREWRDLHRQLTAALADIGIRSTHESASYEGVHRALLAGLLDFIGTKEDKGVFAGTRNRRFYPFPGSSLRNKPPKWLMAAEITETTRVYGRTLAGIEPQWIEAQAAHLIKRQYSEPHWQKRRGKVAAYEKVLLNGLVLNPRRRVDYTRIDPTTSRALFIRHALVGDEWHSGVDVIRANRALIDYVEDVEARSRRRDLLVQETDLIAFYEAVVPAEVTSGPAFKKWVRELADTNVLALSEREVMLDASPPELDTQFPTTWRQGHLELPLSYQFEPGAEDDGVTLMVPLPLLNSINRNDCEWLVPGLLEEKVTALLRALPKPLRRNFVPVPDFARALIEALTFRQGPLLKALSQHLLQITGVEVPPPAWDLERLAPHLRMRFTVRDANEQLIAAGRDLDVIGNDLADTMAERTVSVAEESFERTDIRGWDFGELPKTYKCEHDGYAIDRFPALVDEGGLVALRLFDEQESAERAMMDGVRRLILLQLKRETRYLEKNLPDFDRLCLLYSPIDHREGLKTDLFLTAVQRACIDDKQLPRDEEDFSRLVDVARLGIVDFANEISATLGRILPLLTDIRRRIAGDIPLSWVEAARDVEAQIDALIYPGFLAQTPPQWVARVPVYLEAIQIRLSKLDHAPDRDRMRRSEIEPLFTRLIDSWPGSPASAQVLIEYKWLLEELRVSMFAQELGTVRKVSVKRLDQFWQREIADLVL